MEISWWPPPLRDGTDFNFKKLKSSVRMVKKKGGGGGVILIKQILYYNIFFQAKHL